MSKENRSFGLRTASFFWPLLIAVAVAVFLLLLYQFIFGGELSDDHERWGQFGDYFGGVLNPALGFLTLMVVLRTLHVQLKELSMTREEMTKSTEALREQGAALRKQAFEGTFFQVLSTMASVGNSIVIAGADGRVSKGRAAFERKWERISRNLEARIRGEEVVAEAVGQELLESIYRKFDLESMHAIHAMVSLLEELVGIVEHAEEGIDRERYYRILSASYTISELAVIAVHSQVIMGCNRAMAAIETGGLLRCFAGSPLSPAEQLILRVFHKSAFRRG